MNDRPRIFISAVTRELASARDLVAKTLLILGCEPVWQDVFGMGAGDLHMMLSRKIEGCTGLIQLVGQRAGACPAQPDAEFGRLSYTQYELRYAVRSGLKVWAILLSPAFPADTPNDEPEDLRELQRRYRESLEADHHVFHSAANRTELENRVLTMRDTFDELRAEWQAEQARAARFRIVVTAAIAVFAGLGVFAMRQSWVVKMDTGEVRRTVTRIAGDLTALKDDTLANRREIVHLLGERDILVHANAEQQRALIALAESVAHQMPHLSFAAALPIVAAEYRVDPAQLGDFLKRRADLVGGNTELPLDDRLTALHGAGRFLDASRLAAEEADRHTAESVRLLISASKDSTIAGQYPEALAFAERARSQADRKRDEKVWMDAENQYAYGLWRMGHAPEAEAIFRALIPVEQRLLGAEHCDTIRSRAGLALALDDQAKHEEAEHESRAILAVQERVLGAEHPAVLQIRHNLAVASGMQGKYEQAEAEFRAILLARQRVLGLDHPDILESRDSLAAAIDGQGRHEEAEREFRAVLDSNLRLVGPEHPNSLASRCNLAIALHGQGKFQEAEREMRTMLAIGERVLGSDYPDLLRSRSNLADILFAEGKPQEAQREYLAVLDPLQRLLGPEHHDVLEHLHHLSLCLSGQDRPQALEFARRALEGALHTLGSAHPDTERYRQQVKELEKAP